MLMATYRVMCRQETGEEFCVASGLSKTQANKEIEKARETYPEFSGFHTEREIDYYKQARRQYEDGLDF